MLDTECHPYIRTLEDQGFIHSDVETEFERILMEKDGLSPYSHIPTKHIISKPDYAECISLFYDEIKKKHQKYKIIAKVFDFLKSDTFFNESGGIESPSDSSMFRFSQTSLLWIL